MGLSSIFLPFRWFVDWVVVVILSFLDEKILFDRVGREKGMLAHLGQYQQKRT